MQVAESFNLALFGLQVLLIIIKLFASFVFLVKTSTTASFLASEREVITWRIKMLSESGSRPILRWEFSACNARKDHSLYTNAPFCIGGLNYGACMKQRWKRWTSNWVIFVPLRVWCLTRGKQLFLKQKFAFKIGKFEVLFKKLSRIEILEIFLRIKDENSFKIFWKFNIFFPFKLHKF